MSGLEWIIEAHGCDPETLASPTKLRGLFAALVQALKLRPLGEAVWHQFSGPGGITGVCLLMESHVTCHTFPEFRCLCLNVFCCRPREDWDFAGYLRSEFGATAVRVRRIERPYVATPAKETDAKP
jgi:S-adenosylmethionine decarboxylase